MPEGGKLEIQTSKSHNLVQIAFKDTGVCILEKNLPKLFTPLFSTKAKGIGLGLTISKQIVIVVNDVILRPPMRRKANVLIVDDDIGMTETLCDILEYSGYHVEVADDGFKAIEKVKARTFDTKRDKDF